MSDFENIPGSEDLPDRQDPIEEMARNAVFYPDLETASQTYAMETAVRMILESIRSGEELDKERLGRLADIMNASSTTYVSYEEDGTIVSVVDGVEVERIALTPEYVAWRQKERFIEEYRGIKAAQYIKELADGLDAGNAQSSITTSVNRGERLQDVPLNQLELCSLEDVKWYFRRQGCPVREEHKRIRSTAEVKDHTLHTLTIERAPIPQV